MGSRHLARLARARDLLSDRFDTSDCVLACYSGKGFDDDIRAAPDSRVALIRLADLYRG
jgi:hypothetical protein